MARDIKLDQIRARLGDLDKPRDYDPYKNEGQQNFDNDEGGGDDEGGGSTINAGFIATMLGLFISVSGGTYMYSEGINPLRSANFSLGWGNAPAAPLAIASSVDGTCGKGWKEGQRNNDILHCYLITSPSRLCSPRERSSLVAVIMRHNDDYDDWMGRANVAAFKSIGKLQVTGLQIGLEDAKMQQAIRDPKGSDEEVSKHMENITDMVGDVMSEHNDIMAENPQKTDWTQLQKDLVTLAKKDMISVADFPGKAPKWVTLALKDVKATQHPCTN